MAATDDSAMYTGVDLPLDEPEQEGGMFGNEKVDEKTQELLDEQRRKLEEITPQLQGLLEDIDEEIKLVFSIKRFITAAGEPIDKITAELQAAALYEQYLQGLKTKFTLRLNEATGGKA